MDLFQANLQRSLKEDLLLLCTVCHIFSQIYFFLFCGGLLYVAFCRYIYVICSFVMFCFLYNLYWQLTIRCKDIVKVTKEKTARVIPNAIQICTKDDKYFFTSFGARDKTFLMLERVWKNGITDQVYHCSISANLYCSVTKFAAGWGYDMVFLFRYPQVMPCVVYRCMIVIVLAIWQHWKTE